MTTAAAPAGTKITADEFLEMPNRGFRLPLADLFARMDELA